MAKQQQPKKVPVTIVTGFLGSGKTTLLNYILTADHGKKIAVIENEFGDQVGIEKLIAKDGKGGVVDMDDLFVEVSNGCICCAVKDDLVTTIERLMTKRDKFDYILLETSGLADPGPLASVFWLDDELESDIYLDAVVTVVDARNFEKNLSVPPQSESDHEQLVINEAFKQVAYADRILINKKDLVSEEQLDAARDRVAKINPLVEVVVTEYSAVPLEKILDVGAFDPEKTKSRVSKVHAGFIGESEECSDDHCEDHDGHCGDHDDHCGDHNKQHVPDLSHVHDKSVKSISIQIASPLDLTEVKIWLGMLLWEPDPENEKAEYFRIKGVLHIKDSTKAHILQGVHESFDIDEVTLGFEGEPISNVVFIGRHLNKEKLKKGLETCIAK